MNSFFSNRQVRTSISTLSHLSNDFHGTAIPHQQHRSDHVLFDHFSSIHKNPITDDHRLTNPTGRANVIAEPWINLHDSIKPTSKPSKIKKPNPPNTDGCDLATEDIRSGLTKENLPKLSIGINKNLILSDTKPRARKRGSFPRSSQF